MSMARECSIASGDQIDFVIAWVDGADPEWLKEKAKYDSSSKKDETNCDSRYRDWDLLRYWFRAVEKYASWVGHIYFVTWGHIPNWLDVNNPKLRIIKHTDFIPKEYLPTFSSHVIELNLHRIQGLSERFVYFNDDMFLLRDVTPDVFFKNRKPRDIAALNVHCCQLDMPIQMIACKDTAVVNAHFNFKNSIRHNLTKWFQFKYGTALLRTVLLLPWPRFPGFYMPHCPQSYLKKTFHAVWNKEETILAETCSHRFRCENDVNQWVMRCWQIAEGQFEPRGIGFSKSFMFEANNKIGVANAIADEIAKPRHTSICINDAEMDKSTFELCRNMVVNAFQAKFPHRSSFEIEGDNV